MQSCFQVFKLPFILSSCLLLLFGVSCAGRGEFINTLDKPAVLNNFVTELIRVSDTKVDDSSTLTFHNPRDGWVFFGVNASVGRSGNFAFELARPEGSEVEPLIAFQADENDTIETMRNLSKGNYVLHIRSQDVVLKSMTVRTVPVLMYNAYGYTAMTTGFARYDWSFLERVGILDNCNTIQTNAVDPYIEQWLRAHREIVKHCPAYKLHSQDSIRWQDAYEFWARQPALVDSSYTAAMVDEFYAADPVLAKLPAYRKAMLHIIQAGRFNRAYLYLGDDNPPYRVGNAKNLRSFVEPIAKAGGYFAFERYLQEKPSEVEAKEFIKAALVGEMKEFETYAPGFAQRCVIVVGTLTSGNEFMNNNPNVDFKVNLDMQFQLMATDPSFVGLHGIQNFVSGKADAEALRWYSKLLRHYCIEGNQERLCNDPYELKHIQNGDFAEGLKGWVVQEAGPDCVTTSKIEGYGNLQGRYPKTDRGDTFLLVTRCEEKANIISQTIRNLTPGRYYSARMISGDYDNPTVKDVHYVSFEIEGAQRVIDEDIQGSSPNSWGGVAREESLEIWKKRDRENYRKTRMFFNYHQMVFRASVPTATLKIYDWYTMDYRKGAVGQKMMINLVEVAPYLMPGSIEESCREKSN